MKHRWWMPCYWGFAAHAEGIRVLTAVGPAYRCPRCQWAEPSENELMGLPPVYLSTDRELFR